MVSKMKEAVILMIQEKKTFFQQGILKHIHFKSQVRQCKENSGNEELQQISDRSLFNDHHQ